MMLETIFSSATGEAAISFAGLASALGVAIALGLLIALTYMKTHKTAPLTQGFALTLAMLPAVVTIIILLVGSNVARAFSLAGAFAIIRFRSAPGDPKDITYVLFAMAVGLASGMGFLLYAVVVAVTLCAAMAVLEAVKFGHPRSSEKLLKITVPEDLDFQNAFDGVLQKYTLSYKLQRIRTTDLGSLYELCYTVVTKEGMSEKDFIDDLRCRNGNLRITLVMDAPGVGWQTM